MEADDYSILQMLAIGGDNVYAVPTYQREYKWTKTERNEFFDDILENDIGYFLGSIICVSVKEGPLKQHWELVDGQQRMISLSLILAAIYSKLNAFNKEKLFNKTQEHKLFNIKSELILDDDENQTARGHPALKDGVCFGPRARFPGSQKSSSFCCPDFLGLRN